jgi:OmpA-OmpF porin, OOP family
MIGKSLFLLLAIMSGSPPAARAAGESGRESQPNATQQTETLQQIESLQHRSDKLYFGKLGANNYHLSKARTWLDMAFSEYRNKDTTGIVSASIAQAEALLDALENNQTDITMDTPMQLPGSEKVRTDLWDKITIQKKRTNFSCGQRPIAQAEVYLVWTGHEKSVSDSHAESYATTAEDMIYAGQVAIDICDAAPPEVTPPAVLEVVTPPATLEKITLSSDTLFAFDKATLKPSALGQLDKLAVKFKAIAQLEQVILIGHTDRLRSDGHPERNQLLSEQRAESIKQYLISKGIAADKILASGAGSTQPVMECSTKPSKHIQIDCLQPNRRVEIILRGGKAEKNNKG